MKFSTRAEYGLKAIINLAKYYPKQKSLRVISREENISRKYLERLVNELRKNNLVASSRGKNGGYALTRNPKNIRVGEIIEVLEGPISTRGCELCHAEKKCSSSVVWLKLEREIKKTLDNIKLSELTKKYAK
jgi:Rrf2 family protein